MTSRTTIQILIIVSYLLIIMPYIGLVFSIISLLLLRKHESNPKYKTLKTLSIISFFINTLLSFFMLLVFISGYFVKEIVSAFI